MLIFALCAIGAAQAQDSFSGFYVGGNAGGAFGRAQVDTSPAFSLTGYFNSTSTPAITSASNQLIKPNGLTAGGGAGFNHQWDNFVFGLEADFGTMNLSGTTTATAPYPCCPGTGFTVTQTAKTNWLFTVRPRVGFVFGRVMVYETVGAAFTSVKYTGLFTDTFASAHENASLQETRPGWVLGGGAEGRISHRWSVKGEYLYAGFGTATVPSANLTLPNPPPAPPTAFPSTVFTHSVDLRAHLVRAGVNYRF